MNNSLIHQKYLSFVNCPNIPEIELININNEAVVDNNFWLLCF